jgi:pimeloyl-ACP methyl ester carboxylesterase
MADPIPAWPGELLATAAGESFVRAAPAESGAQAALFVHGLGGSSTNWTDLMDEVRSPGPGAPAGPSLAGWAVDLPGFGFSPPPRAGGYTLSAHAAAVIGVIDRLGIAPVHLIGNSMGGAVCTRVVASRPDLVRSLILVSPALPDLRPSRLPLRLVVGTSPGLGPWLIARLGRVPAENRTYGAIHDLYADPTVVHPLRWAEEVEELRRRDRLAHANAALIYSARSIVAEYLRHGARSLWRDAAAVSAPALILYGSHDRMVSPRMAAKAARTFPDARVLVLPRVGHVAMMEQPAIVAREIRAFLAGAELAAAVQRGG